MKQENALMDSFITGIYFPNAQTGDVVSGIVVAKEPGYLLISVGGVAVGIIAGREMHDGFGTTKNYKQETRLVLLSSTKKMKTVSWFFPPKSKPDENWDFFEKCLESGEIIEVIAKEANKGGLICDANGVHAFLPVSQLAPQNYPRVDGANAQAIIEN